MDVTLPIPFMFNRFGMRCERLEAHGSHGILRMRRVLRLGTWKMEISEVGFLEPLCDFRKAQRPTLLRAYCQWQKTPSAAPWTHINRQYCASLDDTRSTDPFPMAPYASGWDHCG
jgi:hypothetical protein